MNDLKRFFRLSRLSAFGRVLVCGEFALAVGIILYVGLRTCGDVFEGSPPALPVGIDATCESAAGPAFPCRVSTTTLNAGRFRIATDVPAARLTLALSPAASVARVRVLLLRVSRPNALDLDMRAGPMAAPPAARARLAGVGSRTVIALPAPVVTMLSFVPEPGPSSPLVLDELGFFVDSRGLLNDTRSMAPWIPPLVYYGSLIPGTVVRLCAFTVLAAFFVPGLMLKRLNPFLLGLVCLSLCSLELTLLFTPYGAHDLRLFYAAGPLLARPGGNLNTSVWQGFNLLHGHGLTFLPGRVPWERMPGYALFCAAAGALFGRATLLDVAMAAIVLQVIFYSVALGVFAWAAGLLWSPPVVWTLGLLVSLLPKQLGYTQVDSVIAPAALLILAALCVRLNAVRNRRPVPIAVDIFIHLAFALWFVMRPDVLPGWLIISGILHWRSWRRVAIPLVLFLSIGIAWGAYKARYTHEFVLTTSSAGASLFCGLWEVPSRFALTCSDDSYFGWVSAHTPFEPKSNAANSYAVREVLKFWLTYPGHFAIMLDHKIMESLEELWPGYYTALQEQVFRLPFVRFLSYPRATFVLVTVIAVCVVNGYERYRTLLLGWPLFLNAPLFWVLFASLGRFYSAVSIALLAAGLPPLFERPFYASVVSRPWRTAAVLACAGVAAVAAWPFHDWLLHNDAFHYWTPLLDPARSPLSGFK